MDGKMKILTKKVKLNMHNKYLAHVAPQSATILNSSLNYRVLLQNKISFLKNDEEVNSISLRNQSLILAIFGPNISRLGNGCRFWLVDAVLVFLQLFLGDFFLFFYIKPQNSFFSDGVKDGWSLSLPFGTSEIIHHRSVEVRSWKLSCNTQKVKT